MFGNWFKRHEPPVRIPVTPDVGPLFFKDGYAALTYICKYMDNPLAAGNSLPAVVMDPAQMFGTTQAVKIDPNGNQIALLRVASSDGGFLVMASTVGHNGPKLQPGQLVVWKALTHSPELAQSAKDQRFGWVGLIVGTLKPECHAGNWTGDQRFR